MQTAKEQALTVAAIQAAGLILLLEQISVAVPLVLACGVAQIALGGRIAYLASQKRDAGRGLVIDGRERLPIPTVQRELRRLTDAGHQAVLAHSIDELADEATHARCTPPSPRPVYDVHVIRTMAAQLHETARLLRRDEVPARGVAHVEALITSCSSPCTGLRWNHYGKSSPAPATFWSPTSEPKPPTRAPSGRFVTNPR